LPDVEKTLRSTGCVCETPCTQGRFGRVSRHGVTIT
jgi:hypothetical protein